MSTKSHYIYWISLRYLLSKKTGKGLSLMTFISVFGVALGVLTLVVILSVMGGFERDLRSKIFNGLPHMEVLADNPVVGFSLLEHPLSEIQKKTPEARHVEPFIRSDVVIKQKKHLQSVSLIGIDPNMGGKPWGFSTHMIEGSIENLNFRQSSLFDFSNPPSEYPSIVLGESLAIQLGANLGEEITILSPQAGIKDALAGIKLSERFVVTGIFLTNSAQLDSKIAVVNLEEARKFMVDYDPSLDEDKFVTGVAINTKNPDTIEKTVQKLNIPPQLKAITWKETNKSLLFALKLEKFTMSAILLLIVLVAAFSISATMMMTVFHRRNHVALLRSLGMTRKGITKLFISNGAAVGIFGIVVGLGGGLIVTWAIDFFQFISLPDGVYHQAKLPVKYLPFEYVIICVSAWLLSVIAAAYPAFVAATQSPSLGIRYK